MVKCLALSLSSAQEYEIPATARRKLAETLSRCKDLLTKYKALIDKVEFSPTPDTDVKFQTAFADATNPGVEKDGEKCLTKQNPFVDDTLMADILPFIKLAMAGSIEALYVVLGPLQETIRINPLSLDKFFHSKCSFEREQLGLLINTRTMTVSLPPAKIERITALLNKTWHASRKRFTILEGVQLLGVLEHASMVNLWSRYLVVGIRSTVNKILKRSLQIKQKDFDRSIACIRENPNTHHAQLQEKYFTSQHLKALYHDRSKATITKEMHAELACLRHIFEKPDTYKWEAPIAHLIPLIPTF